MKNYLAVFTGSPAALGSWEKLPEAERKRREVAGMAAWKQWVADNAASIVEMGGPGNPPGFDANLFGLAVGDVKTFENFVVPLPAGIDHRSASRHPDWTGPDDLEIKIEELRDKFARSTSLEEQKKLVYRFAKLVEFGVPVAEALHILVGSTRNGVIREDLKAALEAVNAGREWATAMTRLPARLRAREIDLMVGVKLVRL